MKTKTAKRLEVIIPEEIKESVQDYANKQVSFDEQFKWLKRHMEEYIQKLYEKEKKKIEMINLLHTYDETGFLFFTTPY